MYNNWAQYLNEKWAYVRQLFLATSFRGYHLKKL